MEKNTINVIISIKEECVDLVEAIIKKEELDDDEEELGGYSGKPVGLPMSPAEADNSTPFNVIIKEERSELIPGADVGREHNYCNLNLHFNVKPEPLEQPEIITLMDGVEQGLSYTESNEMECGIVESIKSTEQTGKAKNKAKEHQCSFCFKVFPYKSLLKLHKRVHTGEKPYKCTYCEKTFSQTCHLRRHEHVHTDKPHKCTYCKKSFTDIYSLRIHERVHTGEKPHKCTYCEKTFITSSNLSSHERVHTGEKPHKCTYCGKTFASSSNLRVHEWVHKGEKPHKCTYCGKAYAQAGKVKLHEQIHAGGT